MMVENRPYEIEMVFGALYLKGTGRYSDRQYFVPYGVM